eukprot:705964-Rhodomonas_salina.2
MAREPASAKSPTPAKVAKLALNTTPSKKSATKTATAEKVVRKPRGRPPGQAPVCLFALCAMRSVVLTLRIVIQPLRCRLPRSKRTFSSARS